MKSLPRISIVVPSFNQAQFLPETLQSLVDQDYPDLEVVIQDGVSSDESVAIAEDFVRRYPAIFQLHVEQDTGQANALNRGFARTTGEILAFLNSDDTYYPRILHRVAAELDTTQGRAVIMGRCLFTGEGSHYVGIEHPAEYVSHFEHLAIWKRGFNTVPQPSVFWHRTVWEQHGGLDENEHHALDYDLFCRFSRYNHFHRVDELFSTYRMHDNSKSSQRTEAEVLELSVAVSRKHWGPWTSPLRWRCEFSLWLQNQQRHERARHHARRAEKAFSDRKLGRAGAELIATLINSPKMARDRLIYGWLAVRALNLFQRLFVRSEEFVGRYPDGWIGPVYRELLRVPANCTRIVVTVNHAPNSRHRKIETSLLVNDCSADMKVIEDESEYSLTADAVEYREQEVWIELRTSSSFTLHDPDSRNSKRRVSLHLNNVETICSEQDVDEAK